MNESVVKYLEKYPDNIKSLFYYVRDIIYQSVEKEVKEKLWANIPSYYLNESFVRIIPFKDHINIEAKAINNFKEKLEGYKVTPKGMLQLYINDEIPRDILLEVFKRTLG